MATSVRVGALASAARRYLHTASPARTAAAAAAGRHGGRRREKDRRRGRRREWADGEPGGGEPGALDLAQFQARVARRIEEIVAELDPSVEVVQLKLTCAPRHKRRPPAFQIVLDTDWERAMAASPSAAPMGGAELAALSSAIRRRLLAREGGEGGEGAADALQLPPATTLEFTTAGRRRPLTKAEDLARFAGHRAILYLLNPAREARGGGGDRGAEAESAARRPSLRVDPGAAGGGADVVAVVGPDSRRKVRGVMSRLVTEEGRQYLIVRDEDGRGDAGPPAVAIAVADVNYNRSHIEPLGALAGPVRERKTKRTKEERRGAAAWIGAEAARARVVVFCKSYCPHCKVRSGRSQAFAAAARGPSPASTVA